MIKDKDHWLHSACSLQNGLHRNTWGILKLDHKTGQDVSSVVSPFVSTSCLMNTVQCGVLVQHNSVKCMQLNN